MNEYTTVCQGQYRGMRWEIVKDSKGWFSLGQYSGRVKPIFMIGDAWMELDRFEKCITSYYNEYICCDSYFINNVKESIKRIIDFLWSVDENKRIKLYI